MAGIHEERDTKSLTLGALFVQRNIERTSRCGRCCKYGVQGNGSFKKCNLGKHRSRPGRLIHWKSGGKLHGFIRRRATGTNT